MCTFAPHVAFLGPTNPYAYFFLGQKPPDSIPLPATKMQVMVLVDAAQGLAEHTTTRPRGAIMVRFLCLPLSPLLAPAGSFHAVRYNRASIAAHTLLVLFSVGVVGGVGELRTTRSSIPPPLTMRSAPVSCCRPRLPQERVQRDGALQQELLPAGKLSIRHDPRARRRVLPVPQDHRARTHP